MGSMQNSEKYFFATIANELEVAFEQLVNEIDHNCK